MKPFTALHFSDTHNDVLCWERFDFIREHHPNRKIILTGDTVGDGKTWQYTLMEGMLRYLEVYPCPGNHCVSLWGLWDFRKKLDEFNWRFKTSYGNRPQLKTFDDEKVVLIGLNSNPGTFGWIGDFARGKIGRAQLQYLSEDLEAFSGWTRIVYLHHHLLQGHLFTELTDADKLIDVLANHCEVVLMGHFHEDEMLDIPGIPLAHAAGAFYNDTEALEITVKDGVVTHRYVKII